MIINESLRVGGAIVLWNLSEFSDQEDLEKGLTDIGLKKFAPARRPPVAALREAMQEIVGGPRILVRPLEDNNGWCALEEKRGRQLNQYEHVLTARIDDQLQIAFSPFDERAQKVVNVFNEHAGYLHTDQVSQAMVDILTFMRATSLRRRGALYWIPDYRIEQWGQVAQAVEDASVRGSRQGAGSAVYLIRNIKDADACRAVMDSIITEVQTDVDTIDREIRGGKLGVRGLEHRQGMAQELRKKVSEYEELLGVELLKLHELVDQTETAACKAAILASAAARNHAQAG